MTTTTTDPQEPPPLEDSRPSEKVLRELKRQAVYLTQRIQGQYQANRLESWDATEAMFGIDIPDTYKARDFTYANLSLFYQYWIQSYEVRITTTTSAGPKKLVLAAPRACSHFGPIVLKPRQQPVYEELRDALFNRGERAMMQDGQTGSGKSYVGAALIHYLINEKKILSDPLVSWRPHPFLIFSPKAVAEKWRRTLEAFGLGRYVAQRKILVFESSGFSNFLGREFVSEHEDPYTEEIKLIWDPVKFPYFAIVDECHEYVRPSSHRTKCMLALGESDAEHILDMSATPIECVNDSYQFVLSLRGFRYQGMKITKSNFEVFAQAHDPQDPSKPNATAVKKLRSTLAKYIISMPYAKPKHKAINIVFIVDFEKPEDKAIYDSIYERYLEVCRKVGKDPNAGGRFKKAIALNKFRHGVEPLRGYWCATRAAQNYHHNQKSTIIGCAYKETIATIIFKLIEVHNVPRSAISVIWGGRKDIKQGDILPPSEISSISMLENFDKIMSDPTMLRKLKATLKFRQDAFEHGEDAAQQLYRHDKLREFKLTGTQSENARQIEIDRFMSGATKICIMTVDTGGVGLDLDCKQPHIWPRECLFTQIYSGRKFLQLLGRSVREDSIADAEQYLLMMRDTVEEYHVAPILDAKLKSNSAFTNRTFDIVDILENKNVPVERQKITSAQEMTAHLDAEDTIIPEIAHETEDEAEDGTKEGVDDDLMEGL